MIVKASLGHYEFIITPKEINIIGIDSDFFQSLVLIGTDTFIFKDAYDMFKEPVTKGQVINGFTIPESRELKNNLSVFGLTELTDGDIAIANTVQFENANNHTFTYDTIKRNYNGRSIPQLHTTFRGIEILSIYGIYNVILNRFTGFFNET